MGFALMWLMKPERYNLTHDRHYIYHSELHTWSSAVQSYEEKGIVELHSLKAFDRNTANLNNLPSFGFPMEHCWKMSVFLQEHSISFVFLTSYLYKTVAGVHQHFLEHFTRFTLIFSENVTKLSRYQSSVKETCEIQCLQSNSFCL